MARQNRSTEAPPFPQGLQIDPVASGTIYIGKRRDILSAGILPPELLPKKIHDFEIIHEGRRIRGGRYGWGKWVCWEIWVSASRGKPALKLIPGGKLESNQA